MKGWYLMNNFLFLGGDLRMLYAAERLNKGYDCFAYGFQGVETLAVNIPVLREPSRFDSVVLPLPTSSDGVNINAPYFDKKLDFSIIEQFLLPGGTVYTSRVFPYLAEICEKGGYVIKNYFEREELLVMNAVPTAEGALEIALRELPITLFGANVLIAGYGRIGKVLAKHFSALGSHVSVCARKCGDVAAAEASGAKGINLLVSGELEKSLPDFDVVINTVPAPIFDRARLAMLKKDCLVIDLASKTGIEDMELAKNVGVNVVWALSLPREEEAENTVFPCCYQQNPRACYN